MLIFISRACLRDVKSPKGYIKRMSGQIGRQPFAKTHGPSPSRCPCVSRMARALDHHLSLWSRDESSGTAYVSSSYILW
ncbi:hypothetical protein RRG08_026171 [Elysia crispata]|uniref:Uncharacterized protein n=1 Tax=Elysia crispata TaxID=231223 RepID=A0AAE0ZAF7_9GAST|nr:hypothetical protein RRG08_026171 [Elysia crispata]